MLKYQSTFNYLTVMVVVGNCSSVVEEKYRAFVESLTFKAFAGGLFRSCIDAREKSTVTIYCMTDCSARGF